MRSLPYFSWYPADAEVDEFYSSLNDAELGFFHRCLNKAWINDGLPNDLDKLAAMTGRTRADLDKVWSKVSEAWEERDGDGRLVNFRQEQERQKAVEMSERNASAARKRYERSASAVQVDYNTRYVSVYGSDSSFDFEVWFSARMRKHPIPGKPQIAQQYALDKISIGKLNPLEFDVSHDAWCEYWKTQEGGIPTLATFIFEGWYERIPPETKKKLTAIEEARLMARQQNA